MPRGGRPGDVRRPGGGAGQTLRSRRGYPRRDRADSRGGAGRMKSKDAGAGPPPGLSPRRSQGGAGPPPGLSPRRSRGRIVPVARELALDDASPVDVLRRMRATGEECFLLESVEGGETVAQYTFLGVAPSARLTAVDGQVAIERDGRTRRSRLPLLPALEALTTRPRYEPDP